VAERAAADHDNHEHMFGVDYWTSNVSLQCVRVDRGFVTTHRRGTEGTEMELNEMTDQIIGAAIGVHKALRPGLLESAYEECPCCELRLREFRFER
jgi:hypothetical protein